METGESWDAWNHMEGSALGKLLSMAEGMWIRQADLLEAWVPSLPLLTPEISTGKSPSLPDPALPKV